MNKNTTVMIRAFAFSLALSLASHNAFAKLYDAASLSVVVSVNCQTGEVSVPAQSPPFELTSTTQGLAGTSVGAIDQDRYEGNHLGFNYGFDNDGNLVLTKKGEFLFGKDVSMTLGKPDSAAICAAFPNFNTTTSLRVNLLPNIKIQNDFELTGGCYAHSDWPNSQGSDYYHPVSKTIQITDVSSNSVMNLSLSDNLSFQDINSCVATTLP